MEGADLADVLFEANLDEANLTGVNLNAATYVE